MKQRFLAVLLFLLPVSILLPNLGRVAFRPGSQYTDLLVSHYPNMLFLQQSILNGEGIPFWSPLILSGYPFAANPLSGLHYPPGWAALLLPLPLGITLLMSLHILWGGAGAYRFLRLEGLGFLPSLFGGVVYTALPKLYSHLGAGHVTLVYAAAWVPWLLVAERWSSGRKIGLVLPGAVLGVIALADPRMTIYAGLLWAAWRLYRWLRQNNSEENLFPLGRLVLPYVTNAIVAVFTAAPLLLPLMEYTALSTRSLMTDADHLVYSLPPAQLLYLVYPNFQTSAEWTVYPGAALLALLVFAIFLPPARRRGAFWMAAAVVSLTYSLGANLPLIPLLARLPGFSLLRVPPRALFVAGFAAAILASIAFDEVGRLFVDNRSNFRLYFGKLPRLVLFGLSVFILFLGTGSAVIVPLAQAKIGFLWGGVFWLASIAVLWLAAVRRIPARMFGILMISFCLLDWTGSNFLSLEFRSLRDAFQDGQRAADFVTASELQGRMYSPSYSVPQHVAAQAGLELAGGVDPLQLSSYVSFLSGATGVPQDGYSVTLPPFATGHPQSDNAAYPPNMERLGWLAVRTVASAFPIPGDLRLLDVLDGVYLYENPHSRPYAWVQMGTQLSSEPVETARITRRSANRIEVTAAGPGVLVLSEIAYPGWFVSIDGSRSESVTVGGLLRGVALGSGEHAVIWQYQPGLFFAGWALFGFALLTLLLLWRVEEA